MSLAVDRILERRARLNERPATATLVATVLLHGFALALFLLLPKLTPPPPPPSFVPVTILPAQALGVRRPASRPKPREEPPAPKPEPEKPAPEPEPEPEPVREEAPVLPEETKKPEKPKPAPTPRETAPKPAPEPSRKPQPPPKPSAPEQPSQNPSGTAAQGTPEGEAGRRGDAAGTPLGTTAFGSAIAGLDNPDFKFGYYIDQLLGAIDAKWARPNMGGDVRTIISFRIQRNGGITDLEVAESSGYNSFDLAALRAVQNASPFPPLPRGYRQDSLGVRLIVR